MAKRINIRPGQSVGMHLTPDERETLLAIALLGEVLRQTIEQAPAADQNVMFTLAELAMLAKDIAVETGRTKDRRLQMKLNRIIERIERLNATFEEGA